MNNALLKNVLFGLGLATVLLAGYYVYTQKGATVLGGTGIVDVEYEDMISRTQVFIQWRQELEGIKLNTQLFEDEHFRSLRPFSKDVKSIETGRPDPFAPVAPNFQ